MDIPGWFVWIAPGLVVLQALGLVPVIRRLRGSDSSVRSEARLDLLDVVGSLLLFGGLLLSLAVAESWFRLALAGFALMAAVYAVKAVRWLRARRCPRPDPNDRL
ncbi:hypothetical protein [Streptomyces sp. enrichment culture]|uniref:hypothetical protein n=1 Tax=Streptomyces sp. enrichment culture TaxID=1795815 RepID=UPI003F56401C